MIVSVKNNNYQTFITTIKQQILACQHKVGSFINTSLVKLYWDIGKQLHYKQKELGRGANVVEQLAKDLRLEFPGIKGFSSQNLWYMKKFYETYSKNKKLQPLVGEIGWGNNIVIMDKCKDDFEREFYLKLCSKQAISKRILMNKIDNKEYERYMISHESNNFFSIENAAIDQKVENILKDSYIFDFLSLGTRYSEQELEKKLFEKLKRFIMELGMGFAYMGNQFEIKVDNESYFLDLLFYHTKLKCYIVIELKIGSFKPEYAGKLNFYVNIVDKYIKTKDDKDTIGMLLCKEKNKTIVEIALKGINTPLAVSEYTFDAKNISSELKNYLPSPEKLKDLLDDL